MSDIRYGLDRLDRIANFNFAKSGNATVRCDELIGAISVIRAAINLCVACSGEDPKEDDFNINFAALVNSIRPWMPPDQDIYIGVKHE